MEVGGRAAVRVLRGFCVCLPAIGALLVLHLAKQDRKRMLLEKAAGNARSSLAFRLAFLCDAGDVAAHVIIITALMHQHFAIGLHIPHALLHLAEHGGMAVAMAGTAAAIMGELMAMKRGAGKDGRHLL